MTSQHPWLTNLIRQTAERYVAEGAADSFVAINSGLCGDFSREVIQAVGSERAFSMGLRELGIENFLTPGDDIDDFTEGNPFDRELIAKHWPDFAPPVGLDWDTLDRISADATFNAGTHVWLSIDRVHYDAECPEGVASPFDLPFFQRVISGWIAEFMPSPAATAF